MEGGGASAGAGASLGLTVGANPVEVGQVFPTRASARLAAETELAKDGRAIKNGKSAGSRQFHVTCKTCTTWFVMGCLQSTKSFKITAVGKNHVNCVGGGHTATSVVMPLVKQLVRANPKIGGPAIKRTLKTAGFDLSVRESQRSKKSIVTANKLGEAEALARLPSLFEAIEKNCPGSVATIEVSFLASVCGCEPYSLCKISRGLSYHDGCCLFGVSIDLYLLCPVVVSDSSSFRPVSVHKRAYCTAYAFGHLGAAPY